MEISVGKPVVVHGVRSNNHDDQPGLVSCVHSRPGAGTAYCNVVVLPDCGVFCGPGAIADKTSINVYADDATAQADANRGPVYAVLVK